MAEYTLEDFKEDGLAVEKETSTIITDLNKASWAFRALVDIERKKAAIEVLAKEELDRINNWKKEEMKAFEDEKQFFEFNLEQYFKEQKVLDPKFKLSTPYGKVTSRKQQPKWNYEDDKTLEWLKENDKELIRVKEEIDKAELKKKFNINGNDVVTEDGEVVPGINIETREDSVTIKVEI